MPYVEANHKNEPLLPRSASFGSQSQLHSQLQKLTAKASNVVSSVCQGEEAGVKLACLNGGLAGLAIGLLGVLNPFAVLTPLHLLTCLYLLAMSLVVLALEVEVPLLEPFYAWVGLWMRSLTTMTGRGVMYLVLGSLAAGLGDWLAILAGLALMGAGAACLWFASRFPKHEAAAEVQVPTATLASTSGGRGDDARVQNARKAFRRRVYLGMQRMETAELVALCRELHAPLDERVHMAAILRLDPHQQGSIDEESFVQWWVEQTSL